MFRETRSVTLRSYVEMRQRGLPDARAFRTAVQVFQHRTPGVPHDDAQFVVADWICEWLGETDPSPN